jgi:hypothetical protein
VHHDQVLYLRGAAGIGLETTNKYLRRTTSAVAGNGLGATIKYLVNQNTVAGNNWAKAHYTKAESPCGVAAYEVNSVPRIGARPSVRVCVELELARCVIA